MCIYSALLIALNRKLPGEVKIRGVRLIMMTVAFLFFGFFSVLLV